MIKQLAVFGLALAFAHVGLASGDEQGWLGVHIGSPEDDDLGVIIHHVIEGQPADGVLQEGDLITAVDGETVVELKDFVAAIRAIGPGETVRLDLIRDGRARSVSVELGLRPKDDPQFKVFKSLPGEGGIAVVPRIHGFTEDFSFDFGGVSINIDCDEGQGTITIERPGGVETHEFDCSELGEHKIFMHAIPEFEDMEDEIQMHVPKFEWKMDDFDLPKFKELSRLKGGMVDLLGQPKTRFNVNPNGEVEVTVRKGASELVLRFENIDDLRDERPDLAEKYDALMSELENDE